MVNGYLLEDVLLLAVNNKIVRETDISSPASVVTLALTPNDVQKVNGAKAMGDFSLSLRKPGDKSRTENPIMPRS